MSRSRNLDRRPTSMKEGPCAILPADGAPFAVGAGKRQSRAEPAVRRFVEGNRATVRLGEIAHDSQTQTRAGRCFVRPDAALYHGFPQRRLQPGAIIIDIDRYVSRPAQADLKIALSLADIATAGNRDV